MQRIHCPKHGQKVFLVMLLSIILILAVGCQKPITKESNESDRLVNTSQSNAYKEPESIDDPPDESGDGSDNKGEILIGVEYAMPGMAEAFSELGIPAVKQYPDAIRWDKMQASPTSNIDFRGTDRFVREYQDAGFTTLVIALKPHNLWASKNIFTNPSPKAEYMGLYKKWVEGVVERYDMDGKDDMPGLKQPVIYYEIGTEFSSYEPEPVKDYLEVLEAAYNAAHSASDNVVVLHAAFLTTTVFKEHPTTAEQYEEAFKKANKRIMEHSLADIREVLDKPEFFDALNIHSLGEPYEIEDNVRWINYEMKQRGYKKPIIISDTLVTPFAGYGPATICKGQASQLSLVIPPATEDDRCRIADYFKKLVDKDPAAIAWVRSFSASDIVKRVVVAAEQGIVLIDTAFMEDLPLAQSSFFRAAAGNSAWGGMTETKMNIATQERAANKFYPAFFALRQLAKNIKGYDSVERISSEEGIRLYKFTRGEETVWVAWFEPDKVILPGDDIPEKTLSLDANSPKATIEPLIIEDGQKEPIRQGIQITDGKINIALTPAPVFIFENT